MSKRKQDEGPDEMTNEEVVTQLWYLVRSEVLNKIIDENGDDYHIIVLESYSFETPLKICIHMDATCCKRYEKGSNRIYMGFPLDSKTIGDTEKNHIDGILKRLISSKINIRKINDLQSCIEEYVKQSNIKIPKPSSKKQKKSQGMSYEEMFDYVNGLIHATVVDKLRKEQPGKKYLGIEKYQFVGPKKLTIQLESACCRRCQDTEHSEVVIPIDPKEITSRKRRHIDEIMDLFVRGEHNLAYNDDIPDCIADYLYDLATDQYF